MERELANSIYFITLCMEIIEKTFEYKETKQDSKSKQ